MTMKSTPDGFLAGQRVDDAGKPIDEQAELLADIKGDTGKLLDVARAQLRATSRPTVTPAGRSGPASTWAPRGMPGATAGAMRVAAPAGRSAAPVALPRDSAGRFIARDTMRLADYAAAADRLAQATERQTAPPAQRDAAGRFQGGSQPHTGAMRLPSLPSIAGAGQVDPLLAGASEAASMLRAVAAVAMPRGRLMGGKDDAEPVGLLRALWREVRGLRKEEAGSNRTTLAKLAALAKTRGAAGGGGGGLLPDLTKLLPALPSLLAPLAAAGGGAALAIKAAGGLVRRIPLLGAAIDGITGIAEDHRIASDSSLTPEQQRQARAENAGGTLGSMGGALAGAVAGQAMIPIPVVGAVVGALAGGYLGKKAGQAAGGALGSVSARFESGGAGAGAVSTGKGDFGGASYGTHQLSSKTGTLQQYLGQSRYGAQFAGLQPGTPEFNAKWKQVAASDPAFGQDQKDFIGRTHFDPQMARLAKAGIDLSGRGDAVKEAVWSTAVQFGGNTDLIKRALAGRDVASMNDADVIAAIQDHKIANNSTLFRSSSAAVQAGTLRRANEEKRALLAMSGQSAASQGLPGQVPAVATFAAAMPKPMPIPQAPAMVAAAAIPAMPQVDTVGPQRLTSSPQAVAPVPPPPPSQDVRDRLIAHIVTGGIGGFGGIAHR